MDKEAGQITFREVRHDDTIAKSVDADFAFLNIIVDNGNSDPKDLWMFANELGMNDEEVMVVSSLIDIFDLLFLLKAFPSKGQARKNWKYGDSIPKGWSEFKVGKFKHHLSIWNPQQPRVTNEENG